MLLWIGVAEAQDADTFAFSGSAWDDQGTLELSHPSLGAANSWYAGVGLVYADDPLVIQYEDGREESVVSRQFSTRLQGGYDINEAVRLDLEVPLYPFIVVQDQQAFAMGDIQLAAMIPIAEFGDTNDGIGFGLRPVIVVPSGRNSGTFTSRESIGGSLAGAVGGYISQIGWRVNLGMDFGPKSSLEELDFGTSLDAGGGFSYRPIEEVVTGAELQSKVTLSGGTAWNKNPMEAHVYGGYLHDSGFHAMLGLGTGLIAGIGAPDYRVALALGYRDDGDPPDLDHDGVLDDVDRCIEDPEDLDSFQDLDGCPDPDNDADKILDEADSCPDDPEDWDGWEDTDGCPDNDNDGDGIPDGGDDCPDLPGTASVNGCPDSDGDGLADDMDRCPEVPGPLATEGCPDRDRDRVPDFRDECPDEPISPKADPRRSNGCPTRVIVTHKAIVIVDRVYFRTDKSTIKSVSYDILDEVAAVLVANPDIELVEIAGHTDSDGPQSTNLELSQRRAEAVVAYLVKEGVSADRLVAKGYGESTPIDSNSSSEGKANNRRVEFVILKQ
ncbi:MAG TPA: OmpA family protein [Myxococcota bacterium]|nr:OmpA family protein [Myxococcota bacterium]